MKKYMVLYLFPVAAGDQVAEMSSDQKEGSMAEWMAWKDSLGDALVDFGMPLATGKHIVFNAVSEGNLPVTGYSIVQAESMDAAVGLLKNHPHFKGAGGPSIEVLEFAPMPGA